MTAALQADLERFYDYEQFDLDSLDQVKFRKAIVQDLNIAYPLTDIKESVSSLVQEDHSKKQEEQPDKKRLDDYKLRNAYAEKMHNSYQCFNDILSESQAAKYRSLVADVMTHYESQFTQGLVGGSAADFAAQIDRIDFPEGTTKPPEVSVYVTNENQEGTYSLFSHLKIAESSMEMRTNYF